MFFISCLIMRFSYECCYILIILINNTLLNIRLYGLSINYLSYLKKYNHLQHDVFIQFIGVNKSQNYQFGYP
ncbi:Uncharacterised protein [Yersinia enterocolitica]|nr:Uncharacterised protein [Yersinia enterocolitica]